MGHLSRPCNSTFSDREGTLKSRPPLVRKSVSVPRVDFTGCSGVGCGGRSEACFPKPFILAEPYRKPGMTSCRVPGLGYVRYCPIPGKTRPCHPRPISETETAEIHRGSVFCSVSRQLLTCRPGPPTKVKLASEPRLLTPSPVSRLPHVTRSERCVPGSGCNWNSGRDSEREHGKWTRMT